MNPPRTILWHWAFALVILTPALMSAGCIGGGLLIKPVSTKDKLVENQLWRDSIFATDKIALIDVGGILANAAKTSLLGAGEHPVSLLLEQLDKARNDRAVKAVILRINSPGGTATASELMHDEILHFKESGKPVIAVVMDLAASGGYYIACACDEIVAQPSSVIGSIGVVMQMFDVSGTMRMIGVTSDAITSGDYKDAGSPFRTMRPEEREVFQGIVNDMYERFVAAVAKGRPLLDAAAAAKLADGRVYSASQALERGLIDRIATLREGIRLTKKRVGTKNIRLVAYRRPYEYRPNYYLQAPQAPLRDSNWLSVELSVPAAFPTPRFMYLWSPGIH